MTDEQGTIIDEQATQSLHNAAHELADYIRRTGRQVRVFGVTPPVRKILHTALNDEPDVGHESAGYGMFRHLVLEPAAPPAPAREENAPNGESSDDHAEG